METRYMYVLLDDRKDPIYIIDTKDRKVLLKKIRQYCDLKSLEELENNGWSIERIAVI